MSFIEQGNNVQYGGETYAVQTEAGCKYFVYEGQKVVFSGDPAKVSGGVCVMTL